MNEQQFNANLKAAFVAPVFPTHMESKIDAVVSKFKNRKQIRRRVTLSLGATAAVASGIFVFPAVKAQAALGGMMSALDKQTSARIFTYTVDEKGNRFPKSTTIMAEGNVESRDAQNRIEQVEIGDTTFAFDSNTRSFIASQRNNQGIRLSQMLSQASRFTISKRVELEKVNVRGRVILRATVTDTGLPERLIIEADPNTELPFHAIAESFEMGKWRIRQEHEFAYLPGLKVLKPDFTKTPVLTMAEKWAKFNDGMTESELGRLKLKDRTVIIRKIDISRDGTVFIAYQAGNRDPHRWSGSYIGLSDNLGTEYVQSNGPEHDQSEGANVPVDGILEMEVIVPIEPQNARSKKLSLFVNCTESGKSDAISIGTNTMNGVTQLIKMHNGNQIADSGWKGSRKKILDIDFDQSTCDVKPSWASSLSWLMRNEVYAEIYKADKLAADAMQKEKWESAETHLNDSLHWKRESEIQGFSGWEQGQTLKDLEKVKLHLKPSQIR